MAAVVECDDAAAVFLQLRNPGRIHPVHILGRRKAMHQQDRIAVAFVEVGNLNSAVVKIRHRSFHIFGKTWVIREDLGDRKRRRAFRRARRWPPEPVAQTPPPSACAAAAPSCGAATTWSGVRWWP